MSQVHYQVEHSTLAEVVAGLRTDDQVVIANGPLETAVYLSVTFPRETHWKGERGGSEDEYTEVAAAFETVKVLTPGSLKPGDRFWTWIRPAYDLEDVRRYHEEGFSRSPVVRVRESVFPFQDGPRIAVLHRLPEKEKDGFPLVCAPVAEEGPGAEQELRRLLKSRP